jgi:hypothetical protein
VANIGKPSWSSVAQRLQHDGYAVDIAANPLRGIASDSAYLADVAPNTLIPIGEGGDRICPERLLDDIAGGRRTGVHEGYP